MDRIDRTTLYMSLAETFAERSTCLRGQVGCVIVREGHMIGAGYNGAPPGMPHCTNVGCGGGVQKPTTPGDPLSLTAEAFPNGCTRAVHAELNALAFSARHGIATEHGSMYCTHAMCRVCAQAVLSAGIQSVVYREPYRDPSGLELLEDAGLVVIQYGTDR